jgi:hypothetical protein
MNERIAILVIHGIGEQRPYETLDHFAHGLLDSFATSGVSWSVQPQLDVAKDPTHLQQDWVRASLRLIPPSPQPFTNPDNSTALIEDITLFEYYWAPITQDKISYTGSLTFLINAGLKPFKYFASNLDVLSTLYESKVSAVIRVILKELWRQACLFLPLILLLVGLLSWLSIQSPAQLLATLRAIPSDTTLLLVILAIRYLYLFTTAQALHSSLRAKPVPSPTAPPPQKSLVQHLTQSAPRANWQTSPLWRLALFLALAGHIFLWPLLISSIARSISRLGHFVARNHQNLPQLLGHWSATFSALADKTKFSWHQSPLSLLQSLLFFKPHLDHYHYLALAAFALLAYWVRFILIDYIGDIAVYVNSDQLAKNFAARSQILDECSASLIGILKMPSDAADPKSRPFDRVLVAGHSLGSVIAYDTLNELLNRARTLDPTNPTPLEPADLDKLRGMVTFGSPLNKIFYLFREQIDPRLALRRQTIDLLHGFRVLPQLLYNSGTPAFLPTSNQRWMDAQNALTSGFCWINAYSLFDPISGKLVFYDLQSPKNQQSFQYSIPGAAHLSYWSDPNFYTFVRKHLL